MWRVSRNYLAGSAGRRWRCGPVRQVRWPRSCTPPHGTTDWELASFAEWLATDDYSRPVAILRAHKTVADPAALLGSLRNLDPEGGRTTSNLKVSLAAAVASLTSSEGAAVCGLRSEPQFDMEDLITTGGTRT